MRLSLALGAGLLILLWLVGVGSAWWKPRGVDDATIRAAVVGRLQASLNPRGILTDCEVCDAGRAFVKVRVAQGKVTVDGVVARPDEDAVRGVRIDVPGVRSVTYALQTLAPVVEQAGPRAPSLLVLTPEQLRSRAYVMTGEQKMREHNFESARSNFEQAVTLDPENAAAVAGLEAVKTALGQGSH